MLINETQLDISAFELQTSVQPDRINFISHSGAQSNIFWLFAGTTEQIHADIDHVWIALSLHFDEDIDMWQSRGNRVDRFRLEFEFGRTHYLLLTGCLEEGFQLAEIESP